MGLKAGLCAVLVAVGAAAVYAGDWPKWRGPQGDGIIRGETLAKEWAGKGPRELWRVEVGQGYSSPVMVDGVLYVFSLADKKEGLVAIDPKTGNKLWARSYENAPYKGRGYVGTRATPTVAEGVAYTLGAAGDVVAFDLKKKGEVLWQTNVLAETGAKAPGWGTASSPLVMGDMVYVQVGNGGPVAVGLNKKTGKMTWQAEQKALSGYAHVVAAEHGGKQQLVVFGGKSAFGVDPATGKTLWEQAWPTKYEVNASTPIVHEGKIFLSSGYGQGSMMLELKEGGVEKLWETKEMQNRFQGSVLDGGYLYGNSEGTLKCMKWGEPKIVWENKGDALGVGGSVLRFEDRLIVSSERGRLFLYEATPEGVKKVGESRVFDDSETWATPLVHEGKLYWRGGKEVHELVALDIGKQ